MLGFSFKAVASRPLSPNPARPPLLHCSLSLQWTDCLTDIANTNVTQGNCFTPPPPSPLLSPLSHLFPTLQWTDCLTDNANTNVTTGSCFTVYTPHNMTTVATYWNLALASQGANAVTNWWDPLKTFNQVNLTLPDYCCWRGKRGAKTPNPEVT